MICIKLKGIEREMIKRFILILIFSTLLFSNEEIQEKQDIQTTYKTELKNGIWITDKLLGQDSNVKEYYLTQFSKRKFVGNLTYFEDNGTFASKYISFCGNDYFTTVRGKYKILDNKLTIIVDSVEVIFLISKENETFVFSLDNNQIKKRRKK